MTPKKETKANRRPIPYERIAQMWAAGKTHKEIAKAIGRYDAQSDDPTKPVRAICSNMKRLGWRDKDGKLQKLRASIRKSTKPSAKPKKLEPKEAAAEMTRPQVGQQT